MDDYAKMICGAMFEVKKQKQQVTETRIIHSMRHMYNIDSERAKVILDDCLKRRLIFSYKAKNGKIAYKVTTDESTNNTAYSQTNKRQVVRRVSQVDKKSIKKQKMWLAEEKERIMPRRRKTAHVTNEGTEETLACDHSNPVFVKEDVSIHLLDGIKQKKICWKMLNYARKHSQLPAAALTENDVEIYNFYVLKKSADKMNNSVVVGFFMKRKSEYFQEDWTYKRNGIKRQINLSLLYILPKYRHDHYAHLLVDFSYHLSRQEGGFGTPEQPLDTFVQKVYERYWKEVLGVYLYHHLFDPPYVRIEKISKKTGIDPYDIAVSLHHNKVAKKCEGSIVLDVEQNKFFEITEQASKNVWVDAAFLDNI